MHPQRRLLCHLRVRRAARVTVRVELCEAVREDAERQRALEPVRPDGDGELRAREPARTDRQLSPEKTEAILAGGMQEFLAHGYAATSMDRVAMAAKFQKRPYIATFKAKKACLLR